MDSRNPRKTFEIYRGDRGKTAPAPPKISIKTRVHQLFDKDSSAIASEPEMPSPVDSKIVGNQNSMKEATRFINDHGEIHESVIEMMSNNVNFNVISAIGPQGSGKSTILSMLAGNECRNMYREYIFRPVSREANELSRHQSVKTDIFKSNNQIFIDCQPINSFSIFEMTSRGAMSDDAGAKMETVKLISFLLAVSHTLLVCTECFIDMNLIKIIRMAELIRPRMKDFEPRLSTSRKTKIVFIQTKAQSLDFSPSILSEREHLLRQMFSDSRWIRVSSDSGKVIIPLVEIKLRKDHGQENFELDTDPNEHPIQNFDEAICQLRRSLLKNKESFRENGETMDEKKWVEMCQEIFKDTTFISSLRLLRKQCAESVSNH